MSNDSAMPQANDIVMASSNNTTDTSNAVAMFTPLDQEPSPELVGSLQQLLHMYKQPNPPSDAMRNLLTTAHAAVLKHQSLHWWCNPDLRPITKELFHLFSLAEHDSIVRYKKVMDNVIGSCIQCAEAYYADRRVYLDE